ncbi:MAG TPA: lysophospholipid acyltransferase family protein [Candidatus Saccharimonadales bacterium]|nr:lysophospholipid acyltransferase family protein [Candidatus Saccharimonadales bacterium]
MSEIITEQPTRLLAEDYYQNPEQFKINRPLHLLARKVLLPSMAVLHGRTNVLAPETNLAELEKPVVIAATHRSWEDIPRTVAATREVGLRPIRFVFKAELNKPRALGYLFEKLGGVAVERHEPDTGGLFKVLGGFLDEGDNVAIYPEATRKREDVRRLGELKPGASVLAGRRNLPMVPLAIAGMADGEHPTMRGRMPVVAVFGEPITREVAGSVKEMQAALEISLQNCLDEAYEQRELYSSDFIQKIGV